MKFFLIIIKSTHAFLFSECSLSVNNIHSAEILSVNQLQVSPALYAWKNLPLNRSFLCINFFSLLNLNTLRPRTYIAKISETTSEFQNIFKFRIYY